MIIKMRWLGATFFCGFGLLAIVAFTLFHAQTVQASGVYCVVPPGNPTGPFAPCDYVFYSIQQAVDAAAQGEEIWVAGGVYTDSHQYNGLWQMVYVAKSVTIRGGYEAPFTAPPDPEIRTTTLDAQELVRVLYMSGNISVTVAGLHLTGGQGTYLTGLAEGGGIYADGVTVTLKNNVIDNNFATAYGGGIYLVNTQATLAGNVLRNNVAGYYDGYGGGIAIRQSNVILSNNTLISNTAGLGNVDLAEVTSGAGGGLFASDSQITLTHNNILSNTAMMTKELSGHHWGAGGGVALFDSDGTVTANKIAGNVATIQGDSMGGGFYVEGDSRIIMSDNLVLGNVASVQHDYDGGNGGGIAVQALPDKAPVVSLHNNRIVSNTATITGSGFGGGVGIFYGEFQGPPPTITLTSNLILSNTAAVSSTFAVGGGMVIVGGRATVTGNFISGNTALLSTDTNGLGGGIYLAWSRVELAQAIIQGNTTGNLGGGLGMENSILSMTNSVICDNRAGQSGAGLAILTFADASPESHLQAAHTTIAANNSGDGSGIYVDNDGGSSSSIALTNTILVSHTVGISVTGGNMVSVNGVLWYATPIPVSAGITTTLSLAYQYTGNPHFAADGYHLLPDSAAVGRGVAASPIHDIDGEPRRMPPDLGADEFWTDILYLPAIWRGP